MKYLLILLISLNLIGNSLEERINYIYQEEKLAYEIYTEMDNIYNKKVFENISRSEEEHMEAILTLANDLDINIYPLKYNQFTFDNLSKLKEKLVKLGKENINMAFEVGVKIEELDIIDLERLLLEGSKRENLTYSNLLKASKNHLSAFKNNLMNNKVNFIEEWKVITRNFTDWTKIKRKIMMFFSKSFVSFYLLG